VNQEGVLVSWGFAKSLKSGNSSLNKEKKTPIDIHAEIDCITYAAKQGIKLQGASIFITSAPCKNCLPVILASGISHIYHGDKLTRYINDEHWALSMIEGFGCNNVEDLEVPDYKLISTETRSLFRREANTEDQLDIDKLSRRLNNKIISLDE